MDNKRASQFPGRTTAVETIGIIKAPIIYFANKMATILVNNPTPNIKPPMTSSNPIKVVILVTVQAS